jgi:DNA-binding MarR family transcriptional regulator
MSSDQSEDRILTELDRRAAIPEHLEGRLGVSAEEIDRLLDRLEDKAWISRGRVWYGDDPSTGITVISLTPAGRREAERRKLLAEASSEDEPLILTKAELSAELRRRLGWTDEQIALNPTLRGDRFYFWPSLTAWASLPD